MYMQHEQEGKLTPCHSLFSCISRGLHNDNERKYNINLIIYKDIILFLHYLFAYLHKKTCNAYHT